MWATRILLLLPQLILVPYLIATIGESGFGVYALVWPLMMSIDQLERSLQSGVVKYCAGFLAQGNIAEVNKVVSSSFFYSLLLATLGCGGMLLAAVFYDDPSGRIGTALVVMSIMVLFIVPLTPYIAVIQSRQRYYVGAIAETISKYISLGIIVIWFRTVGPSVEALVIIMAGMLFLSRFVQVPIAHRLVPGLRNRLGLTNWKAFRLIAAFGMTTVLASFCLVTNSTGIRWIMGILISESFVTHLAIMLMPGLLLAQIVGAVTITIMPATSAYEATGNQRMLQEILIRGMRYTALMALAGLLVAGLLMHHALNLWVGPDYLFLAPYALILFASQGFMQSASISHHMLKGLGRLRAVVLIYALGLVIVPISLILAVLHTWHNPYFAVVSGLGAGQLVCACLNVGYCAKVVHADFRTLFVRVYAEPFLIAAAVCLITLGLVTLGGFDGLLGRLAVSVLAFLLFSGGSYAFIATAAERQQVKDVIQLIKLKLTPTKRMPEAH